MSSYQVFAKVYDELMDQTPYEQWFVFLQEKLKEYDISTGLVLDLGCGTGTMTERFAKQGFDMIGVDNSMEMLNEAFEKKADEDLDILYLCQDMRAFELFGTVRAVYSICDSVNYMLEDKDLVETFRLVNNYLDPEGIFIFDFNTDYKYHEIIGNQVIAENRDDCSFIWENTYDENSKINVYELSLFIKEGDLYRKHVEEHYQKGYTLSHMKELLHKGGMEFVEAVDAETLSTPTETSERIYIVAREKEVKGKLRTLLSRR